MDDLADQKQWPPANRPPLVGCRQLNQNNAAERLRESLRLFLKLEIDA
jgi:hypothetical protein